MNQCSVLDCFKEARVLFGQFRALDLDAVTDENKPLQPLIRLFGCEDHMHLTFPQLQALLAPEPAEALRKAGRV